MDMYRRFVSSTTSSVSRGPARELVETRIMLAGSCDVIGKL